MDKVKHSYSIKYGSSERQLASHNHGWKYFYLVFQIFKMLKEIQIFD